MHIIRLKLTRQFVRIDEKGRAAFTNHSSDATRFDRDTESARVIAAIPHSLGAKRIEVKK